MFVVPVAQRRMVLNGVLGCWPPGTATDLGPRAREVMVAHDG